MIAKPKDFWMSVMLLVLAGGLYAHTATVHLGVSHAMGPMFFPRLVLYCIGGLSLILLVQSLRPAPGAGRPAAAKSKADPGVRILQWSFTGLFLLYLLALPLAGYIWTTLGFLLAGMALLGPRTPRNLLIYAAVAVAVTLGLQYVFSGLLHLFLP